MNYSRRRYRPPFDLEDKARNVRYHIDIMLDRTLTMFRWKGLPETLPERELELMLQQMGYCIVTKDTDGDIIGLWGAWGAYKDRYYMPTSVIVANPWADINKEFFFADAPKNPADAEIEAVLIRNDPLTRGLLPVFEKYGVLSAEADLTFRNALIVFRAMLNLVAGDDRTKMSADLYLQNLQSGKLASMQDADFFGEGDGIKSASLASSIQGYITQVIEAQQYLKGSEMNDLGLQSNYNMKRERLSEAESSLNEDALRPLIDAMLEERQKACEKINEMFGTDISVEFDSSWAKWNHEPESEEEALNNEEGGEETPAEVEGTEGAVENTGAGDPDVDSDDPTDTVDDEPDVTDDVDGTVVEAIEDLTEAVEEIAEELKEEETEDVTRVSETE